METTAAVLGPSQTQQFLVVLRKSGEADDYCICMYACVTLCSKSSFLFCAYVCVQSVFIYATYIYIFIPQGQRPYMHNIKYKTQLQKNAYFEFWIGQFVMVLAGMVRLQRIGASLDASHWKLNLVFFLSASRMPQVNLMRKVWIPM